MTISQHINSHRHDVLGAQINREHVIDFTFDGNDYQGYDGDSLASALLANNIHFVGRSFKYHRPRGIYTAGSEEPNALLTTYFKGESGSRVVNLRAPMGVLRDNIIIEPQNCYPSLQYDIGALNGYASQILTAGFYYKTFFGLGSKGWRFFEYFIRKSAGLGQAVLEVDKDNYTHQHHHCDLLIIGMGAAGLSAALAAARHGVDVTIIDEHCVAGGFFKADKRVINGVSSDDFIASTLEELSSLNNVMILSATTLVGFYDHHFLTALERCEDMHDNNSQYIKQPRMRFWKIRARDIMVAQGSFERPIIFANNDRPGIMQSSAIRQYYHQYGVIAGYNIVLFTNNNDAYRTAIDLHQAGVSVSVVDTRDNPSGSLVEKFKTSHGDIFAGYAVSNTYGHKKINSVAIRKVDDCGIMDNHHEAIMLECDCLGVSGGYTTIVNLFSQSGGKVCYDDAHDCFLPAHNPQHVINLGPAAGLCNLTDIMNHAYQAGLAISGKTDNTEFICDDDDLGDKKKIWLYHGNDALRHQWSKKYFHDFQHDVVTADIALAAREGFQSVEHFKRYTTTGMATDQGKTSNLNAFSILAQTLNIPIADVGVTTFRPPYTPLEIGAVAGANRTPLFLQERQTPMHHIHVNMGAVFEDVGDWKRPWFFPKNNEDIHQSVARESFAARQTCGMVDASTLGKIDIQGKDAGEFLDMIYTNKFSTLKVGSCRYGLMLNEHGMVFDDGVTSRLGDSHYHMTTTTGGAGRVMNWLEEWLQTEWPHKDVYCTSVTEQWAVCSITGPQSANLLKSCNIDIDVDDFPFMTWRDATLYGVPARVFRISFTGDLAFEINVPARYGAFIWNKLIEAGKTFDLCLYGTETLHVLRAEKGFIIVGQETDGAVTPYDLDMGWIVSKQKSDFLGKRSLSRSDTKREGRKQLVGILPLDEDFVIPEGAHLVEKLKPNPPMEMIGHVTSSYYSSNLNRSFGLALVKDGLNRMSNIYDVPMIDGRVAKVKICPPKFL